MKIPSPKAPKPSPLRGPFAKAYSIASTKEKSRRDN